VSEAKLVGAGFRTLKFWTDPDSDFGLTLAELAGPGSRLPELVLQDAEQP
jgi:hypothetical protein